MKPGSPTATVAPAAPERVYRFENVVVDASRREIRVDGRLVDLQPKAFDLLHHLIVHRDRVVDRDELMEALWPGTIVTEDSLTQALRKARKVVGDDGTRQTVIRTVQRRGFRFVAALAEDVPVQRPSSPPTRVATPATARPLASLAVLPFLDLSPERDQRYFCDGLAEELANALGRVAGLRIASRTSAFAYRETSIEARELARRLDVECLLEGSVRRSGDRLRVTAKLVDGSGFQTWTQTWERSLADVFRIQEEIAQQLVDALQPRLGGPERIASVRATSVEAYDLYLRGLEQLRGFGRRSQRFALRLFADALELDPEYAPAWAGKATSLYLLYVYAESRDEYRRDAADAAARAVALDPLSAEAHVGLGNAAMLSGEFAKADAAFGRAETLNPNLFEAWYHHARACATQGDHLRAVEYYERAALVRPDDYEAMNLAAQSYFSLGRREDSVRAFERSATNAERVVALQPDAVRALALVGGSFVALGQPEKARRWMERALTLEPEEPYVLYCAACTYASLGEHELAIDYLERVGVETMANGSWMRNDSTLDPLRGHPRFEALVRRSH